MKLFPDDAGSETESFARTEDDVGLSLYSHVGIK